MSIEGWKTGLYRRVSSGWAVAFLGVGILFVLVPVELTTGLNGMAEVLGLSPAMRGTGGELWHVLAISLMAVLVGLAAASARDPSDRRLSSLMILSKLVSTAGFVWLAFTLGSGWILCAVADGFVALTLVASRAIDPVSAGTRGV
ncbi:MAG: hypothetical protein IT285_01650 [Bdellovibrionales bacterium]|nr:hypothetical protein [Bdellovibrionales bacterium]